LFLAGFDSFELDKTEQLISAGCTLWPHFIAIQENLESSNAPKATRNQKILIVCRSGEKSSLTCGIENGSPLLGYEVEPTLGDSGELVDLRFHVKRKQPELEHDGSLTLPVGVEVKTSSITTESGDHLTESFKASVTRAGRPE
jgi:hypothetical protein